MWERACSRMRFVSKRYSVWHTAFASKPAPTGDLRWHLDWGFEQKFHASCYIVTNCVQVGVEQMQVDLEADGASVEGLARFQQGLFHACRLRQAGIGLTTLALSGWILALFVALFAPLSIWPVVLINCASALLLLVAGLQSAWWVADCVPRRWKRRAVKRSNNPSSPHPGIKA